MEIFFTVISVAGVFWLFGIRFFSINFILLKLNFSGQKSLSQISKH